MARLDGICGCESCQRKWGEYDYRVEQYLTQKMRLELEIAGVEAQLALKRARAEARAVAAAAAAAAESGDTVPVAKPKPVATAKPPISRNERRRANHSVENLTEMLAQDPWNDADVRRVISLGLSADASYSDIDKGIELHERTGPEAQALRFSLLGQCLVAMIVKAVPANTTCLDDLARAVRDLRIFNDEDLDTKSQRRLKFKRAHMVLYLAMLCEYYDITMNRIRISSWTDFSEYAISCGQSGGRPSWRLKIGLHLRALRDHFTAVTDWDDSLILNKPTNLQRALQSASP